MSGAGVETGCGPRHQEVDREVTPSDEGTAQLFSGRSVDLTLAAGPAHGGFPYLVLGSMSGTSPGFELNGVHVPLNWDWFTVLTLMMAGSPQFVDFQGRLDPSGGAVATYDTLGPIEPDLVGLGASFAFISLAPSGLASNPITVELEE